ncbi:MAG: OprO/OprP family phosphate-selective porin [Candidatus Porifericomitaceae bacterium WSBS_2022_MAG_OTU9]
MLKQFIFMAIVFSVLGTAPVYADSDDAKLSLKDGKLSIKSEDGRFSMRIGGRLVVDNAYYFNDRSKLDSGSEIRRARLFVSGSMWGKAWQYKLQYDFAASGDPNDGIRAAYLRWNSDHFSATFGNVKHPFSLEAQTSSKYVTFIERSLANSLFSQFDRRIGLRGGYSNSGLGIDLGLFSTDVANEEDGVSVAARVTYNMLHGSADGRVLHLGAGALFRDYDDDRSVRVRARPESHVTDTRLVDTGSIAGVSSANLYGIEAALVHDRLTVKGEYMRYGLDRKAATPDLDFSGYYMELSWFLTNDSLNYEKGAFKAVKPSSVVGEGGIGAWQVAARYSSIDLTDQGIAGGEQDNITLGVNAYLTPIIRVAADYIKVLDVKGGSLDDDTPSLLQFRVQLEF